MAIIDTIKEEIHKVVIGQEKLINSLLIGLFSDGHILVESVPGLAKTTVINALSEVVDLTFKRIQFTPDLDPLDIVGREIFTNEGTTSNIIKGPIFTNLLLADEINRAPEKVQSALLEVMAEQQITIGVHTYKLEPPFLVLATQNPIENAGTFNLPEAQLDRFMMKVVIDYNTIEEELEIMELSNNNFRQNIKKILTLEELKRIKQKISLTEIPEEVKKYILDIVFATRFPERYNLEVLKPYIKCGASPRATIDFYKAIKSYAYLENRSYVTKEDVKNLSKSILSHRIVLSKLAIKKNKTTENIINKILETIN